ncbi:MAG TPA: hypothetical protein PKA10_06640 [Selenomonadales bacterium]|nr:hypothetical protein [Selenomonadales bacterium]
MNPVKNNLVLSVIVLVIAAAAMSVARSGPETEGVPWLLIAGFFAGSLIFAFFSWRKRAARDEPARTRSPKHRRKGKNKDNGPRLRES